MTKTTRPRENERTCQVGRRGIATSPLPGRSSPRLRNTCDVDKVGVVTSARDVRSDAMAKYRANVAETLLCSVCTLRTVAVPVSRTPGMLDRRLYKRRHRLIQDYSEYQAMSQTIQGLQEQVQRLYADLSAVQNPRDGSTSPYPNHSPYPQQPSMLQTQSDGPYHAAQSPAVPPRVRHRRFQGPTSSAFSINVANSSLQTMGLAASNLTEVEGHDYEDLASGNPPQRQASDRSPHFVKDPIWSLGKAEAIRLCRVYDEEIGIMYPMLDIKQIIDDSVRMFTSRPAATESGSVDRPQLNANGMDNPDCNVLRMVLATALFLEGGGQSELGSTLFDAVRVACESKLGEPPDIGGLRLLVIMVRYTDLRNTQYLLRLS